MPKSTPIQTSFTGGELGPSVEGRVDVEKHGTGLDTCINYIPTLEGPLVRTPGTKRVASVKDSAKPPRLIPFKFSNDEQYIIEAGNNYFRFYSDEGQVVTSGTSYVIRGMIGRANIYENGMPSISGGAVTPNNTAPFFASRSTRNLKPLEIPNTTNPNQINFSSVVSGSILEIATPYTYEMLPGLSWAQKGDTLWLTHSSIPTFTLQRFGLQDWDLKFFQPKDGPYLPLNTYKTLGDYASKGFFLNFDYDVVVGKNAGYVVTAIAHSSVKVANMVAATSNVIEVRTQGNHGLDEGDQVWIGGVSGTSEANNGSSQFLGGLNVVTETSRWSVSVISTTSFILVGSVFVNPYVGSGIVYPAIFDARDAGRNIGFYVNGHRYYGVLQTGSNILEGSLVRPHPIRSTVVLDTESTPMPIASTLVSVWQMGAYSRWNGYPGSVTLHQDRLVFAGTPGLPSRFDASETGNYRSFAANMASSLITTDTNALPFDLTTTSTDKLQWVRSGKQGLYFGSESTEFLVSPSRDGQALTPTNINSDVISNYGSAGVSPVTFGDAIIYVQNSQRKIRELRFFANLQSHRSTLINQMSDHIANTKISSMAAQKETYPLVWGHTSDGGLVSMSYSREDNNQVVAGWARHKLGGRSNTNNLAPKVKSLEVMRDSTGTYDQLWLVVERLINGATDIGIEYMVEPYRHKDPNQKQRDAFYLSCGATYNSALVISSISTGTSHVFVGLSHGITQGDLVLITDVVGFNSSYVHVDGHVVNSTLFNERVFVASIVGTTSFFASEVNNSSVLLSNASYTPYVSGGIARRLVSSISGITWLRNEVIDLLADGKIVGQTTVTNTGVVTLPVPAAVVQLGYAYKSQVATLTKESGSATGSAIGMRRKTYQVAFRVRDIGELRYGGIDFYHLHQANFLTQDENNFDQATPLYTGIFRDGLEQDVEFGAQVFFEQGSPLPGMIQSITYVMDEQDL